MASGDTHRPTGAPGGFDATNTWWWLVAMIVLALAIFVAFGTWRVERVPRQEAPPPGTAPRTPDTTDTPPIEVAPFGP